MVIKKVPLRDGKRGRPAKQLEEDEPITSNPSAIANGGLVTDARPIQTMTPTRSAEPGRSLSMDPLSIHDQSGKSSYVIPCQLLVTYSALDAIESHNAMGAAVGAGVKELVMAISQLEGLGLARFDFGIHIPKLCVLGDQSAGKSSVIEAISGIRVPRSAGTCTRCPLFIELTSNDAVGAKWQAKIVLRKLYDYGRNPRPPKNAKFFGWDAKDMPTETLLTIVDEKEDLPNAIFRAHLATLNPGTDPMHFSQPVEPSTEMMQQSQTKFSPNVVCIHISEPGLPNLSFYDLPGIITQVEDSAEDYLVKFVKNLVTDYVGNKEALILLTCSMEVDMAVSTAASIARDVGARDRCIGVLTKPDRRPKRVVEEEAKDLKAIFEGRAFQLGHGYFVTKQPSSDQLDQSHAEARASERKFFGQTPWATHLSEFEHRFGTEHLQEYISATLAERALKAFPSIRNQIATHLDDVNNQLEKIPKPPSQNEMGIVIEVLHKFCNRVQREMDGNIPYNTWHIQWDHLRKSFAGDLDALKPALIIKGALDDGLYLRSKSQAPKMGSSGTSGDVISLLDSSNDEEEESPPPPVTPKKRKIETPLSTPKKGAPMKAVKMEHAIAPRKNALAITFQLDELRETLNSLSASRLPGDVDPKAVHHLIKMTIQHWEQPVMAFLDQLKHKLKAVIQDIFDESFQKWNTTELYRAAWKIVNDMLEAHLGDQREVMARETLTDEHEGPYMFNKEVLTLFKENISNTYSEARFAARLRVYFAELEAATNPNRPASQAEKEAKVKRDAALMKLLQEEPYRREVDTMISVRSYYQAASVRLHDSICMRVNSKLFKALRDSLQEELTSGLDIYGEECKSSH